MKLETYRLLKEPDKSIILHHETKSFSFWHHHPEYELVLIIKGDIDNTAKLLKYHLDKIEIKKEDY